LLLDNISDSILHLTVSGQWSRLKPNNPNVLFDFPTFLRAEIPQKVTNCQKFNNFEENLGF